MGQIPKWFTRATNSLNQKTSKQQVGVQAELQALTYLQQQGLRLITQNYRSKLGEIDLIMMHQEELIFIEVRYRASSDYPSPLESITPQKQQRIIKTAQIYLQRHYPYQMPPCRFDVVCITKDNLEWIQNAFP